MHKNGLIPFKRAALLILIIALSMINIKSFGQEQDISVRITPFKKDCVYNQTEEVGYNVSLKNLNREPQKGTIEIIVEDKNSTAKYVTQSMELNLKVGGNFSKRFSLGINKFEPGFYKTSIVINTDSYEDTVTYIFGVSLDRYTYELHKPKDFDEFWDNTLKKLAAIDPKYEVRPDDGLSTRFHKVFRVQMTSWDNVRIEGYLTIPKLKGKFPVTVNFAGYLGLVKPVFYEDFAALSMNVRGVGALARQAIPANTEYNTYRINDKDKYIYRGVFMDCVRSIDFIASHEALGLDSKRIVVYGGSQGGTESFVAAALSKKVNTAAANNPVFADFRTIFISGRKEKELVFPMVQFDKYFKQTRMTDAQALKTLEYYDLANFMDRLDCPVLIGIGLKDPISPPSTIVGAFNHLKPNIKAQSKIFYYPDLTHEVTDLHWIRNFNWLDDKLRDPHQ
jgi:cephalosporin-C deacetylase